MSNGKDILIAEDDAAIREALEVLFATEGYCVRTVPDGEAALAEYRANCPDVLLLDVKMPRLNGYAVCRSVREIDATTPILFLTACETDVDQLRGFGYGANDWIVKTASDAVLLARVAAALRHSKYKSGEHFSFGNCQVDALRMTIAADGKEKPITMRELSMLRHFGSHLGEIFSADFLLTRFWGVDFNGSDGTLRVAIGRLRNKLGRMGSCLRSVRGEGYVMDRVEGGKDKCNGTR